MSLSFLPPGYIDGPLTADERATIIRTDCGLRIAAVIGDKRGSINTEFPRLNAKRAAGETLTPVEAADLAVMVAFAEWDSAMVAAREAAIAAGTAPLAVVWPDPPAGVTEAWLRGF